MLCIQCESTRAISCVYCRVRQIAFYLRGSSPTSRAVAAGGIDAREVGLEALNQVTLNGPLTAVTLLADSSVIVPVRK